MKPQIALSVDKMRELKSLGLDCSDASMYWKWKGETTPRLHVNTLFDDIRKDYERFGYTPAYTLEDILLKLSDFDPSFIIQRTLPDLHYYTTSLYYGAPDIRNRGIYEACLNDSLGSAFEMLKWALPNHPDKIKRLER